MPALRERRADLLDWIDRLHAAWAAKRAPGGTVTALRFDADAAEALLRFAWPLNLRGVERLVHELGSSARAGLITAAALPGWLPVPSSVAAPASAIATHRRTRPHPRPPRARPTCPRARSSRAPSKSSAAASTRWRGASAATAARSTAGSTPTACRIAGAADQSSLERSTRKAAFATFATR